MKPSLAPSKYSAWAPVPLRAVIGYGFMIHGWAKLSHGPANFEKLPVRLGVPFHHAAAWIVPFVELLGGFAILIGAFTVHLKYGFSSIKTIGLGRDGPLFGPPGYEVALLYIAGLTALILGGTGAWSVDSFLGRKRG